MSTLIPGVGAQLGFLGLLGTPSFANAGCGGGEQGWLGREQAPWEWGEGRWGWGRVDGNSEREPGLLARPGEGSGRGRGCRYRGAERLALTSRARPRPRGEGRPRPLPSPCPPLSRPQATRESKNGSSYQRTETLPNRRHYPRLPLAATSFFFLSRCRPPSSQEQHQQKSNTASVKEIGRAHV